MNVKEQKMVNILGMKQTKDGRLSLVVDAEENEILHPKRKDVNDSNNKGAWQVKLKKDMERRALESVDN